MSQILDKLGQLKNLTNPHLTTKANNDRAKKIIEDIKNMNHNKNILMKIECIENYLNPPSNKKLWIVTINSILDECITIINKINKNQEKIKRPHNNQISIKSKIDYNIDYYSEDYLLNTLHMPKNYLDCQKKYIKIEDGYKYYSKDYINNEILNKKQHPHFIDIQKEMNYYNNVYTKDHVKNK